MVEETSAKLDRLIDDLQKTRETLREAFSRVEYMLERLWPETEEKRKRNATAIAEIIQESLLSKELPGSRHEISIDGSYFCFTKEEGLKPTEPPPDDIPF